MRSVNRGAIFRLTLTFFLIFAFFVSSSLFIFIRNNIFPIVNGMIMLVFSFLFKGKYRLYALTFFPAFTKCMQLINTSVGSFLTWNMLFYFLVIVLQRLFSKKPFSDCEKRVAVTYLIFAVFMFFVNIININNVSMFKYVSIFSYISIPLLFVIDNKAEKNIGILLFVFILSILLMNIFAFVFIYIIKSQTNAFINAYLPTHASQIAYYKFENYRFSGLVGDPNHNAFYILLATSLVIVYLTRYKRYHSIFIIPILFLHLFAFIGQSKTYFFILLIELLMVIIMISYRKKDFPIILVLTLLLMIGGFFVIISIPILSNIVSRMLNLDTRTGIVESFTTTRLHIWENYLSYLNENPLKIIIGHGVWTNKLFGKDYHNSFIQLLWECGLLGTILFVCYFGQFAIPKKHYSSSILLLPIFVIIMFGLSLHVIYDEFIYSSLFIYKVLSENYSTTKTKNRLLQTASEERYIIYI